MSSSTLAIAARVCGSDSSTGVAEQLDLAGVGLSRAGDAAQQGGLAGPVGPDDRADLARRSDRLTSSSTT